jgi:hypothetical protein
MIEYQKVEAIALHTQLVITLSLYLSIYRTNSLELQLNVITHLDHRDLKFGTKDQRRVTSLDSVEESGLLQHCVTHPPQVLALEHAPCPLKHGERCGGPDPTVDGAAPGQGGTRVDGAATGRHRGRAGRAKSRAPGHSTSAP